MTLVASDCQRLALRVVDDDVRMDGKKLRVEVTYF